MVRFLLILFLGFVCSLALMLRKRRRPFISLLFVIIWSLTLSFSCLGLYGLNPPNNYVVFMGALSIIIFTVFGILFSMSPKNEGCQSLTSSSKQSKPLTKNFLILILTGASYLYIFPFLVKSIRLIIDYGWSYMRYATSLNTYASTAQLMIMQYLVQSIFVITILLTCIDAFNKKVYVPSIIISLFDVVFYTLLFGGRYIMFYLLIFIVSLLWLGSNGKFRSIFKKNKIAMSLVLIVVVLMVLLTTVRSSNVFLKSLYVYFCGSYSYLSYLIDNSIITNFYFCGLTQFGFIYNFAYTALTFTFGIPYLGTNHIISQATSEMVNIGGDITYNSLGTFLESCICDYGLYFAPLGVIIFAFFLNYFETYYFKKRNSLSLSIYLLLIFNAVNSVFSYSFGSPTMFIMLVLVVALTWRKNNQNNVSLLSALYLK